MHGIGSGDSDFLLWRWRRRQYSTMSTKDHRMSVLTRPIGLGADTALLRGKGPPTTTRELAMRTIEMRFASALMEAALPKSAPSFGRGVAGDVARSHLVDRLAQALTDSNAIGINRATEGLGSDPAPVVAEERLIGRGVI